MSECGKWYTSINKTHTHTHTHTHTYTPLPGGQGELKVEALDSGEQGKQDQGAFWAQEEGFLGVCVCVCVSVSM